MPRLTDAQVAAAKAEGYDPKDDGSLKPLPIANGDRYVYRLIECEANVSKAGNSQWKWTFQLSKEHHPEFVGSGYMERLWHYTPLKDGTKNIAKLIEQFGYSPDSETDELIEDRATVVAVVFNDGQFGMKARRFALHDEAEFPEVEADEDEF